MLASRIEEYVTKALRCMSNLPVSTKLQFHSVMFLIENKDVFIFFPKLFFQEFIYDQPYTCKRQNVNL